MDIVLLCVVYCVLVFLSALVFLLLCVFALVILWLCVLLLVCVRVVLGSCDMSSIVFACFDVCVISVVVLCVVPFVGCVMLCSAMWCYVLLLCSGLPWFALFCVDLIVCGIVALLC